jgi:GAF domain-containing protein
LTPRIEQAVPTDDTSADEQRDRDAALRSLTASAVINIPRVDFASVTLRHSDHSLETIAATDPLAEQSDSIQYELREGPCYAAANNDRLVLVNDVARASDFPNYGPRAADLGVRSQLAMQLVHNGEQAGLNLYSRKLDSFDPSTVQLAELFATQAAAILKYALQVEQLSEALHTRTDIGTAVGILMERYHLDRDHAFAFLIRNSTQRNIKVRVLALQVIDSTFTTPTREDLRNQGWP